MDATLPYLLFLGDVEPGKDNRNETRYSSQVQHIILRVEGNGIKVYRYEIHYRSLFLNPVILEM